MLKTVTDFLRKHIDAPLIVIAKAAMGFFWKTFAVVPPALQHVVMATAGGVAVVASAVMKSTTADGGLSSFLMIGGVAYGALGVCLYWLASRKPWNAATYKKAVDTAEEDRQARILTRLSGLFITALMFVSTVALARSGQVGESKTPLLMGLLFLTMTVADYCRAAVPPNPDEGQKEPSLS
jgi:hypothetical protein